jgi:hypothetical protein
MKRRNLLVGAAAAVATIVGAALVVVVGQPALASTTVIQDTNQGTGTGQVQFSANWNLCTTTCSKAPDNSYRWTSTAGSTATVRFTGHQISLFGVKEPWSNIATVSIDGGATVDVDFYANPATSTVVQVYASPTLTEATHTLVLTMTSRRNPSSSGGSAITFDRAEVQAGTPPATSTIQDTAVGTTVGHVQYTGASWTHCGGCSVSTPDNSYYYGYTIGDSFTVRFHGTQVGVYAPTDNHGGIANVTVDGSAAGTVNFYTAGTPANGLRWTSATLASADHTVVFTISSSTSSDAHVVLFDRAEVTDSGATGSPTPSPPPSSAPALSGAGVADPYAFGTWRGTPVQVWETWNNYPDWASMEGISSVHTYFTGEGTAPFNVRFPGALSFAQPMWASGESAASCNSGASDTHMRNIFTNLRNAWGPNAYVRLGWEMNGYWFPQNYAPSNPTGWVNCWRRWYGIIKGVSSGFKLVWNPNWDSNTNGQGGFDVRTVWPGDSYVDAAGPDYYDFNIDPNATGFNGAPVGINQWMSFVASHHKGLAVPEWALNTPNGGVDDASFIQQMSNAFQSAKASSSGLEYQSYFDLDGCTFEIHTDGCNPNAAALYQQLF